MWMARISPTSSVTAQALLTNVWSVLGSCEWRFRNRTAQQTGAEVLRSLRCTRGGRAARSPTDSLEALADATGIGLVQLGQGVTDHPGAMAVGVFRCGQRFRFEERRRRVSIHADHRSDRPGERLLDVRLRVAEQLGDQAEAVDSDLRRAAAPPVNEWNRRDRASDEAPFP